MMAMPLYHLLVLLYCGPKIKQYRGQTEPNHMAHTSSKGNAKGREACVPHSELPFMVLMDKYPHFVQLIHVLLN